MAGRGPPVPVAGRRLDVGEVVAMTSPRAGRGERLAMAGQSVGRKERARNEEQEDGRTNRRERADEIRAKDDRNRRRKTEGKERARVWAVKAADRAKRSAASFALSAVFPSLSFCSVRSAVFPLPCSFFCLPFCSCSFLFCLLLLSYI